MRFGYNFWVLTQGQRVRSWTVFCKIFRDTPLDHWRGKIWQRYQRFSSRVSGAETPKGDPWPTTHVKKRFVQFWPIWKIFLYSCPWKINVKFWPIWKMSIPLPASSRRPLRWGRTVDTWCILEHSRKMFLEYSRKNVLEHSRKNVF